MPQILVHLFADYVMQSDWMAMNKSKKSFPCLVHVLLYTSCFLLLTTSWKALLVIGGTHFLIDRFPIIVKSIIWLKNHMNPTFQYVPFEKCNTTGYYDNVLNEATGLDRDLWAKQEINGFGPRLNYVTLWLYIITDNFLHLTINYLALTYL
jgi:hypothetical protein